MIRNFLFFGRELYCNLGLAWLTLELRNMDQREGTQTCYFLLGYAGAMVAYGDGIASTFNDTGLLENIVKSSTVIKRA